MNKIQRIKEAFERNFRALTLRPYLAQKTAVTRVVMGEGLDCEIREGDWKITVDMSEKIGGDNLGPNPGILGRGTLGSCLAICYRLWAAKLEVPISSIAVEIQADFDARGEYGVAEVPPGYSEIRYIVSLSSEASEAEILQVLDTAEAHSSYFDIFSRGIPLHREVYINESEVV